MKEIKAVCLDMDGTILNNHNQLVQNTRNVIEQIRQLGVKVFIVTGRSYKEVLDITEGNVELDGIVTANGMITYLDEKILRQHQLSPEVVDRVIQLAREHHIFYEVHPVNGNRTTLKGDQHYMEQMIKQNKPDEVGLHEWLEREEAIAQAIEWVDELPDVPYAKMYCFADRHQHMQQWISELEQLKQEVAFSTSSSSPHNVEVMVANVHKATGISALLEHYGLDAETVLAIGDSNNDIAMMEIVGYPVAMKNATDQIKKITEITTEFTNDEEGVNHFLKDFFKHKL
ncbi:Cof-type HAD-IIB family hydrolase [Gracilibacillus caseinilyticus]|uniref:Cof-type HAD-IIB family hydrolase n=1 Tax=Gracilibacillus caseinilyticus TaxID=2932256 RepID=A0ABY4F1Y1_9BACI|nr:HAD family hydrolase [Gracilibacillus caseinilyticus]UOQ50072.1 Cof-type HAD-IIB family hydrolase [Gracilibacillus caseinilyticus]